MSYSIENIKGDYVRISSRLDTQITGKVYLNNISLNDVVENAPPDLDTLREIAANITAMSVNISSGSVDSLSKTTTTPQTVVSNVTFNGNLAVMQNTNLGKGTGILHSSISGDITSSLISSGDINDSAVSTGKIADDAVSYAKIQNVGTANRVLGSTTAGGNVSEVEVATDMIANGAVTTGKLADGAVTSAKILNENVTSNKILLETSTNADLNSITSPINTSFKHQYKLVINTDTGVLVYANGALANSVWNSAAGVATHTPV